MTKYETLKTNLEELMNLQNQIDECIEIMRDLNFDPEIIRNAEEDSATMFDTIDKYYTLIEKEEKKNN